MPSAVRSQSEQNPISTFLSGLADDLGDAAQFHYWSPDWDQPGYIIGREEASAMAGGDEEAVHHIVCGNVALHELPKEVEEAGPAEIARWAREGGDASSANPEANLEVLLERFRK
jgi:hypothetical protein